MSTLTKVRTARDLLSLHELNLSPPTQHVLERRHESLMQLVLLARRTALHLEADPNAAEQPRWLLEFIEALDRAGFIRHDIDGGSRCVGRLYKAIFPAIQNDIIGWHEMVVSNEQYELFQPVSEGDLETIKLAIKNILGEKRSMVIILRFGLEDGRCWNVEDTSKRLSITRGQVRIVETKALRELKLHHAELPRVYSSEDGEKSVKDLIQKLNTLFNDPIFQRIDELKGQLREIANSPYKHANLAKEYLDGQDDYDLTKLGLSTSTFNSLKRAGINTTADIINFPKKSWNKVNHLGPKGLEEIQSKMRAIGFNQFTIH